MKKILVLLVGLAASVSAYAQPKEDPLASKMLADARAARAVWPNFPGFKAKLEVAHNNEVSKGSLHVDSKGKVVIEGLSDEVKAYVKRNIASTISHRMDNASNLMTPCAFGDPHKDHPLGQRVVLLNDELHSAYRIRDRQITEVNRVMGDKKFTISVLENRLNAEKKFLSISYVIDHWDSKTGELVQSEGHRQDWTRVGSFDLPTTTFVIINKRADAKGEGARDAYLITVSDHQLLDK